MDVAKYQDWLDAQRKSAERWEVSYENFLSIKPGKEVTTDSPRFMLEEILSYVAPSLDHNDYKYTHTLDLDREIFSVNNKYHFKLR